MIPTKKPRIVAAIQPQNETNNVFKTPTKYTSKCVSVDLKSINGEKLISKPAGSVRKRQPVAMFLFSKLYAVVWTIKKIPSAKSPTTKVWKKIDLNFSSEKKFTLDLSALL